MSDVQTVFVIKHHPHPSKKLPPSVIDAHTVEGSGQDAAKEIDNIYNNHTHSKILRCFVIDGRTVEVDLRPHWERSEKEA